MSIATRIRHSFIGRSARMAIHAAYRLQHRDGRPVAYRLPGGVGVQLFPEGEIAEFLSVQQFFEKTELALVSAYLKQGMKVVDVGANIGLYSILAQKMVADGGAVWAFEPSLESFQRLNRNLSLNGCHGVHAARLALSVHANTFLKLTNDPGFGDAYRYLLPTDTASSPDSWRRIGAGNYPGSLYSGKCNREYRFLKGRCGGRRVLRVRGRETLIAVQPKPLHHVRERSRMVPSRPLHATGFFRPSQRTWFRTLFVAGTHSEVARRRGNLAHVGNGLGMP